MKKINVVKLTICFMVCVFVLNASLAEARSLKVGEVYKYLYKKESIEVFSSTEVEITDGNTIFLGEYSFKNNKLRIVATTLGTRQVQYYQITRDGLVDKDGKTLYSKKGFQNVAKTKAGGTALILSARGGHTDIAKLLIEHGADVNAKVKSWPGDLTALRFAKESDNKEIVRILKESGAKE